MAHRSPLVWILPFVVVLLGAGVAMLLAYGNTSPGAEVDGSGVVASEARAVGPFRSVELAGANTVHIVVGGAQSVVVRGDDNLLGKITTRVKAHTLVVGNTGQFSTSSPMSVDVAIPALDAVTLSGSGIVTAVHVDADRLKVTLGGSGIVTASGTARRVDVALGGSGDAVLRRLTAEDARVDVTGSGRVLVHVTGTLDASVEGTGTIVYTGDPYGLTQRVTGVGTITRGR